MNIVNGIGVNEVGLGIATSVAKNKLSSGMSGMRNQAGAGKTKINWEDFNFPPYLKLIHYDFDEVDASHHKDYVQKLYQSYILWVAWGLLNFLVNIVVVASSDDYSGKRIFYAIFNFGVFQPLGLFVFYKGYRSIVD